MVNKLILGKESHKIFIILILLAIAVFLTYYFHFILGSSTVFNIFLLLSHYFSCYLVEKERFSYSNIFVNFIDFKLFFST